MTGFAGARDRTDARLLTQWGKYIYKGCKDTVERSLADAKQLHDNCYAHFK